jgi:hypothetical protein
MMPSFVEIKDIDNVLVTLKKLVDTGVLIPNESISKTLKVSCVSEIKSTQGKIALDINFYENSITLEMNFYTNKSDFMSFEEVIESGIITDEYVILALMYNMDIFKP